MGDIPVISKDTIKRLVKDIKDTNDKTLIDSGIYYKHSSNDMLKGYALIIGPKDTPYYGGYYFFEFNFPYNYPYSPPILKYCTNSNGIRFHPNFYTCGKVCISILNTWNGNNWSSCQTITTILLSLISLLCKDPLYNEPVSKLSKEDIINYNEIIEYSNINNAILDILIKSKNIYMEFFELFNEEIIENYKKNYDNILIILEKNKHIVKKNYVDIYCMYKIIDYKKLYDKFLDIDINKIK